MTIKEMLEKRAKIFMDCRAIYDKAEKEKRELSSEEKANTDKALGEADELKKQVEAMEQDEARSNKLKALGAELDERRGRRSDPSRPSDDGGKKDEFRTIDLKPDVYGNKRSIRIASDKTVSNIEYERQFSRYLISANPYGLQSRMLSDDELNMTEEQRALQADLPTAGGYVTAPPIFVASLIQAVDNLVYMRQLATMLQPGNGAGIPSLDADPADPTWTAELDIGSFDSTMVFGKRELKPHVLAQGIKVSKTLLRPSMGAINVDGVVRERLAYKQAVVMENAYLNGHGGGQPLGVFTASTNGISTGRDVSTDNTTTAMTADGIKNAKWTLKPQYYGNARWMFHRDGIKQLDKLKDGNGNYLLQPAYAQASGVDRLMGFPVILSEYAPNTFTTGLYVGIFGDFSKYQIQDSLNMEIQVLMELYAGTNQNGYLSRFESDGLPVLEEAFVRVKLA